MIKIIGNIGADIKKFDRSQAAAVTAAIREGTSGVKESWRSQIKSAGMGQRLANTVRGYDYPKSGVSMDAAGTILTKAPHIVSAYDKGVTIRSNRGRFLAIPTENVRRRSVRKLRLSPEEEAGVPLRYIPPGQGRKFGLLVADNFSVSQKGTVRQAGKRALKSGKGLTTVVMYILIPLVTVRKRLDIESIANKWSSIVPKLIEGNLK